jgi:hypothetical protein
MLDGAIKSLLGRNPGEPRIMSGAGARVQNILNYMDSGFRRNEILGNLGFLRVHADFTLVDAILNASIIMTGVGSVSE